jgi:putative phosphonate metabolism protein
MEKAFEQCFGHSSGTLWTDGSDQRRGATLVNLVPSGPSRSCLFDQPELPMPDRYAIYFAPPTTSELWRRSAIWLGRDALTDGAIEADIGGVDPERRHHLTRSARRYGFHATLKAPMALDARLSDRDLNRALGAWAAAHAPVAVGRLTIVSLDGFLALVPSTPTGTLADFAARVVEDFDGFRAPPTAADKARRLGALTPRQQELLERYGYPYVLEEFRFHMTLTDRIEDLAERARFAEAVGEFFGFMAGEEIGLDRLVLFRETAPGAPFRRLRDYLLTGDA